MRIAVSGGVTGGHVYPALRVALALQRLGNEVIFIGAKGSLEESTCYSLNFPFESISLSRHAHPESTNVIEASREASQILYRWRPERIFLKGDITSVPVAIAASKLGITTILHESDSIPGSETLAIRPLCNKVCAGYLELGNHLPESIFTGVVGGFYGMTPLCSSVTTTPHEKPILYVTGGSQGSEWINSMITQNLPRLLETFNIIHQCGIGKHNQLNNQSGYQQHQQIHQALSTVYATAAFAISRAGATTIQELAFHCIPTLLIPLPSAEYDHQTSNAKIAASKGIAIVLNQKEADRNAFMEAISSLIDREDAIRHSLSKFPMQDGLPAVMRAIFEA